MNMTQQQQPTLPTLYRRIDDNEFSEFRLSDWPLTEANTEDARLWEDQWEDEDLWDEFTAQLSVSAGAGLKPDFGHGTGFFEFLLKVGLEFGVSDEFFVGEGFFFAELVAEFLHGLSFVFPRGGGLAFGVRERDGRSGVSRLMFMLIAEWCVPLFFWLLLTNACIEDVAAVGAHAAHAHRGRTAGRMKRMARDIQVFVVIGFVIIRRDYCWVHPSGDEYGSEDYELPKDLMPASKEEDHYVHSKMEYMAS
ncbi:hypothetical protein BC832DRAFT_543189 [Gaertneriomyces semiglobifer]|nr:hypothetical protein BC832DRAFT_543189 [Gaertneriomyces semiglobifer]